VAILEQFLLAMPGRGRAEHEVGSRSFCATVEGASDLFRDGPATPQEQPSTDESKNDTDKGSRLTQVQRLTEPDQGSHEKDKNEKIESSLTVHVELPFLMWHAILYRVPYPC
jgi:hypothetical protein